MRIRPLVAGLLVLLPAASAHASLSPTVAGSIIHDPQVLGAEVVYQTNAPIIHNVGKLIVRSLPDGGPASSVLKETTTISGNLDAQHEVNHDVTASSSAFAITERKTTSTGTDDEGDATLNLMLRATGASTQLAACHSDDGLPDPPPFALDASRIAYVDGVCSTAPLAIVVHDGTGAAPDVRLPLPAGTRIDEVALRGDYVAVTLATTALATRLIELRVSTGATVQDVATRYDAIALQADGSLAAAFEPDAPHVCTKDTLAYYVAGSPTAHPLPGHPCGKITLAGGRIVYDDATGGLHLAGLDGTDRILMQAPGGLDEAFDADDARAAAVVTRCADSALLVVPFTATTQTAPTPATCPLTISSRPLKIAHGKAMFRVSCPMGCQGVLVLQPSAHGFEVDDTDFSVAAGGHKVTFALTRQQRKLLHGHAFLRLSIVNPNQTLRRVTRTLRVA